MGFNCRLRVKTLLSDVSGSMVPALAAMIFIGVAASGLAIDGSRMVYVKTVMQRSLDAAGLAAGRESNTGAMQRTAERYFNANFAPATAFASSSEVRLTPDFGANTITVRATATVDHIFLSLFGIQQSAFSAEAEILRGLRGLELALVLDVTGSMRTNDRIGSLREAAQELIEVIFDGEESADGLYVSVIPYSATVNVGGARTNWLSADGAFQVTSTDDYGDRGWKGCVMARTGTGDREDAPPADDAFEPFLYENEVDNRWIIAPGVYDIRDDEAAGDGGRGPNLSCPSPILSLTPSASTVISTIRNLRAWPRGGTTGNLGLAWGWRVLSPRWRGLWGGNTPNTYPRDYGIELSDKVVIMMTDGINQMFDYRGHQPNGGRGPRGSDFTAYGRLFDFGFGTIAAATREVENRMSETCDAMKAEGIILYTITFSTSPNAATRTLFEECATEPGFYYNAPRPSDLEEAFLDIAASLLSLRISG